MSQHWRTPRVSSSDRNITALAFALSVSLPLLTVAGYLFFKGMWG